MADSITARDLAALRGLLDPDHVEDPGPALPWQLMEDLRELFHCDYLELDRTESAAESLLFEQTLGDIREYDDEIPPEPQYWELYWSTDACNYPDRTGDLAHVTMLSDFLSDRECGSALCTTTLAVSGRSGRCRSTSPTGPGTSFG